MSELHSCDGTFICKTHLDTDTSILTFDLFCCLLQVSFYFMPEIILIQCSCCVNFTFIYAQLLLKKATRCCDVWISLLHGWVFVTFHYLEDHLSAATYCNWRLLLPLTKAISKYQYLCFLELTFDTVFSADESVWHQI